MLEQELQRKLIDAGRSYTKPYQKDDPYREDYESDQTLKRPQPPLVKAPMRDPEHRTDLPRDFSALEMRNDLEGLIRDRRSTRIYTGEEMSLDQLSFLLWATQGIKGRRGKNYATLRTVPCAGARHEFETYLIVRRITGLQPGAYHYLPMTHQLEFLHPVEDLHAAMDATLNTQVWAEKANVVFYWALVPYRAEWRYGIYAHRFAMIDVGHVGQNLYLACTGLGLGTCAIASLRHEPCCETFGLDGEEEYIVYAAPVGTAREADLAQEQSFYSFVEEEDL